MKASLRFLLALSLAVGAPVPPTLAGVQTFSGGTYDQRGYHAGAIFAANETLAFEHTIAQPGPGRAAMMTFVYVLGGKDAAGRYLGDNTVLRYYLDGASVPSLEFKPGAAAGSFVHLEPPEYYAQSWNASARGPAGVFNKTLGKWVGGQCPPGASTGPGALQELLCGMDLADSDTNDGTFQPWMTKWAGKNGPEGSWVNHFRIPFFRSVRVTAQLDWQAMKVLDLPGKWQGNYGSPCGSPPVLSTYA